MVVPAVVAAQCPGGRSPLPSSRHDRRRDLAGLADADPDFTGLTWPDVGDAPPDEPDPPEPDDTRRPEAGPADADSPDDDTGKDHERGHRRQ